MRILLVEDDESIVDVLTTVLVDQNYVVDVAVDGEAGWELVEAFPYNLVLLDVMLPKLDGLSFCRRLRERNNSVLVMMLTVRDNTTDKLLGLNSGADDYVVKPFDIQELVARIRALLRRGSTTTSSALVCGDLRLDPDVRTVTYAGHPLQFSRKEYLLLELFLRNPHRVFSRSAIVEHLWSFDEEAPIEDTIKSHIKNIRQELRTVNADDLIETLYGQGYRINPIYLTKSSPVEVATETQQQQLDATVAQIWQRKKGASLERLEFLEQAIQALQSQTLDVALNEKAVQNAHKLAGSLGTFGLDEGSRLARQIEGLFQSQLDQSTALPAHRRQQMVQQLEEWVTALRWEIEGSSRQSHSSGAPLTARSDASATLASLPLGNPQPLLLFIHQDAELADSLTLEATNWNIQIVTVSDWITAQTQLQQHQPDLILLDLDAVNKTPPSSPFFSEWIGASANIPIVVFAAQDQLDDRLAVAEMGAKLFLPKTSPPSQVLHALVKLLHELNWGIAKILVVDPEPQTSRMLRAVLDFHTVQLTELNDVTQFWETLRTIRPDLLILNTQIPGCDSFALCQSVRQDSQWNWLPVLLLLGEATADSLQRAFAVGADDYATQPIAPELLLAQVFNRLQRSRLLRSQAETDVLTNLANRHQSTQALNQLLQLAHRSQQTVCLATLDLDHFKQINDCFGHVQGDRVLRQFGQFLKQKFRSEDVVARWGGEEFVIGMYGITREDGVERVAEILEEWRSLSLSSSHRTPLYVSFSAGVAQYPTDGVNLQMLYRAADAALYRAKVAGRDRVLSTQWQPLSPTAQVDVALIYPKSDFAQAILRALETRGYHTRWLQSGKEALNQLKTKPPKLKAPVILLADHLPDFDYLRMLRELSTLRLKQHRILLLLSQPNLKGQIQTEQVFDYLLIPCNLSVIMQRLRQALESLEASR